MQRKVSLGVTAAVALAFASLGSAPVWAAEAPAWNITSISSPTNFAPGGDAAGDSLQVTATNVGGAATDGSTITITDSLPAGLTATEITGAEEYGAEFRGAPMSCSTPPVLTCTFTGGVDPGDTLLVTLSLSVAPSGLPASVVNHATVSIADGSVAPASVGNPVKISATPADFGPAPGGVVAALSTSQAGAHPDLTTAFTLNTDELDIPAGHAKNLSFELPPGFVGSTVAVARCTMTRVLRQTSEPNSCPREAMVGVATISITGPGVRLAFNTPVYNIAPAPGEPVALAFNAIFLPVRLDTSVRADGDYGVTVTAPEIPEAVPVMSTSVTVWGVPADHNGPGPNGETTSFGQSFGGLSPEQSRLPLLTNPQQCDTPLSTTFVTDSWEHPGVRESETVEMGTPTGCGLLPFTASMSMLPDTLQAGAPAGYSLDLRVPQSNNPDGLATPNVRKVETTLPLGTVISPSAADGLGVCHDDPGVDPATAANEFGLHSLSPASCDRNAQVGTVQISTPALPRPLNGQVFLAAPLCNPCSPTDAQNGNMVRLYAQLRGEGGNGIIVKLQGVGSINPQTGQITTTFDNNPQLPFDEFKLSLGGGERATLANPRACGSATTVMDLTPWSSPATADLTPLSTFEVTGCNDPQFNPSFSAGTTNNQAGAFSPFTLAFGRSDADAVLGGLQLRMPPGLLGMLSSVSLCGDAQAAAGSCGPESLIGHVTAETGPGADPFLVTDGQVFITGPYKGAPYGLSIVVPAKAGPYTLSGTNGLGDVVVRAAINVDPRSAALTITSDPLPTSLDGIPLQLRLVNVTVDRPGFTFNPTNCAKLSLTGVLSSDQGTSAAVGSPFQVTNCAALAFKPKFVVSTSGHASRANGASLDAKLSYPAGAQANIARVKVDLPKQLPSQLKTLQQACLDSVFNVNPSGCPAGSQVGIAKAATPVLSTPLVGPVFFVSHGGESFPDLVVILQGAGVRVDLTGSTFISKSGITSSTFKTVPDVPISSFELYLPQGPHSALAANGNLCKSSLVMPTEFVAQNGAVIRQNTPIGVTGCGVRAAKARKAHAARKRHKHRGRTHGKTGHGEERGRR
jgi:hypothetical protein